MSRVSLFTVTVQGGRRQQVRKQQPAHVQHRPEPEGEKQNPDDVVDIRYVGGSIPSQSFRMLQHIVGTSNSGEHTPWPSDDGNKTEFELTNFNIVTPTIRPHPTVVRWGGA